MPCVADRACAAGEFCLEGGCRGLRPGEAPPCRDDAGCPDVGADGGEEADAAGDGEVVDRGVRDAAPVGPDTAGDAGADAEPDAGPDGGADAEPDGAADDAAAEDATFDDAAADAAPAGDGALDAAASDAALDGLDLGGLYAVTTTVVFATGGALGEGEVTHHIHRLVALGGARYRVEVFDEAGAPEHVAEADFTAPEGEGRYQFEYAIPIAAPAGCAGSETRFQRGAVVAEAPGRRLDGAEERAVTFDGEGCPAGWLVRVDVRWTPLPDPE
ncbi:MAG: hypothetical protein R3F65_12700 [bacterium]